MPTIRPVFALAYLLLVGCEAEVKIKLGNTEKSDTSENRWQVYATNIRTQKLEYWWSWHESRSDCLKSAKYDLTSSVHAQWYSDPAGCLYVGSNNRYMLYLMNKLYNSNVFLCIAKAKHPSLTAKEFVVIINGYPKETEYYHCALPE